MRALVATNVKLPPGLLDAFERHGIIADVVDYTDSSDINRDLQCLKDIAPYSLVFHDPEITDVPSDLVIGRVPIRLQKQFRNSAAQGRYDLNDLIRKAYLDLSSKLDHGEDGVLRAGAYEVDLLKNTAKVDEKPLALTSKEFQIFRVLCLYGADKKITAQELIAHLYDSDVMIDERSVIKHVNSLNKKIKQVTCEAFCIHFGVRKTGYCLSHEPKDLVPVANDITFSKQWSVLKRGDRTEKLGKSDSKTLDVLLSRRGSIAPKEIVTNSQCSNDDYSSIKRIRSAMRKLSGAHYIKGVYGIGFYVTDVPQRVIKKNNSSTAHIS